MIEKNTVHAFNHPILLRRIGDYQLVPNTEYVQERRESTRDGFTPLSDLSALSGNTLRRSFESEEQRNTDEGLVNSVSDLGDSQRS